MKKLSYIDIVLILIGVVMGAGFASGREVWQFFGVFGKTGYISIAVASVIYICVGLMLAYISISKNTCDYAELISPVDNKITKKLIETFVTLQYFMILVSMTAAGGSLLNQQFGVHIAIGGVVIAVLVAITVIGDFARISRVFTKIVPFLFLIVIITIILVLRTDIQGSANLAGEYPSSLTPNPWIAGILFVAYNSIALVTVAGQNALSAKDKKNAMLGSGLGVFCLCILMVLLLVCLLKDMDFSYQMDLPLLAYASRISKPLSLLFAIVLYGAIYSAAASTLYGCTRAFARSTKLNYIIVAVSALAFLLGLTGFKTIVEYLYPILGYIATAVVILITINFFKIFISARKREEGNVE